MSSPSSSWSGALCVLAGMAIFGVAVQTMSTHSDKNSSDYQIGVGGLFVGLLAVLFGIVMLKTGLGLRLFFGPTRGMSAGGGMGGGMGYGGGGYDAYGGGAYY